MSQVIDYQTGDAAAGFSAKGNETIEPEDWGSFRKQAHRMLDDMVDYVENIRAGPVWQPIPEGGAFAVQFPGYRLIPHGS